MSEELKKILYRTVKSSLDATSSGTYIKLFSIKKPYTIGCFIELSHNFFYFESSDKYTETSGGIVVKHISKDSSADAFNTVIAKISDDTSDTYYIFKNKKNTDETYENQLFNDTINLREEVFYGDIDTIWAVVDDSVATNEGLTKLVTIDYKKSNIMVDTNLECKTITVNGVTVSDVDTMMGKIDKIQKSTALDYWLISDSNDDKDLIFSITDDSEA